MIIRLYFAFLILLTTLGGGKATAANITSYTSPGFLPTSHPGALSEVDLAAVVAWAGSIESADEAGNKIRRISKWNEPIRVSFVNQEGNRFSSSVAALNSIKAKLSDISQSTGIKIDETEVWSANLEIAIIGVGSDPVRNFRSIKNNFTDLNNKASDIFQEVEDVGACASKLDRYIFNIRRSVMVIYVAREK